LLVLSRGRCLAREAIMEAMWPGAEPDKSSQSLRQTVHQLRRVLGPEHVLVHGDTLHLELGPGGSCDLDRFDAALDEARQCRRHGDTRAEAAALGEAVASWRGPVLADTPYDPEVDEVCATLRHRFLRAAERLLDLQAAGGQWDEVVNLAQDALVEDPLHEPFARHLVRGLVALGHHGEAREAYARFERKLMIELDLLPTAQLKELAERADRASAPS
jgi:DNA-binding SARP family transcriptional activator